METLDRIMKLGKSQNIKWQPSLEHMELSASKNIKLEQERNMDFPNEIWSKIIKYLPSNDVYQSLNLVSKRFQSLVLDSGVLRVINFQKFEEMSDEDDDDYDDDDYYDEDDDESDKHLEARDRRNSCLI